MAFKTISQTDRDQMEDWMEQLRTHIFRVEGMLNLQEALAEAKKETDDAK